MVDCVRYIKAEGESQQRPMVIELVGTLKEPDKPRPS
jgi:hypothetical protein